MKGPKKLSALRGEIDKIDSQVVKLINRRGELSCEIGETKKSRKQPNQRL